MKSTQVDLTAPRAELTYVEILTPGGIIRVNVGFRSTRTHQEVVVVEIERQVPARPNSRYAEAHTAPSGEWGAEVREAEGGLRTDIRLTRQPD